MIVKSTRAGSQLAPAEGGGRVRLRTLVSIRWIAVFGQLVALLTVHYGLGFPVSMVPALLVIGASALLNALVTARQPLNARLSDRAAALYLAYDTVQLTALLFVTGGLNNPFSVLILAPAIVSATVLPRGSTISLGLLSGICITLLALWHLPFPWTAEGFALPDLYIVGIWVALFIGTLFIAAYVGSVAEEARRISDALAAAQMALAREQRLSELGAQAAAAAHELGSPLATIVVTAKEMARDLPDGSGLAEDVELLISQSDRCRNILASLARQPKADGGPQFSYLPVSALVRAAAQPHLLDSVKIQFAEGTTDERSAASEPSVARSPEILNGLGNLVQNAMQFARGHVTIETRWSGDEISVGIRDDGPGFPKALMDRLGEPYISTRTDAGHMGLGMFIARTLLMRTGASLHATNRPEGGAEVVVTWQRAALEEGDSFATDG